MMYKFCLLFIIIPFAVTVHKKTITDIINVTYKQGECLYFIGEEDIISDILLSNYFRNILVSILDVVPRTHKSRISCKLAHIKVKYLERKDLISEFFRLNGKLYPFPSFSTIILVTNRDVIELREIFKVSKERYSLQIILIQNVTVSIHNSFFNKLNKNIIVVELFNQKLKLTDWNIATKRQKNLDKLKKFQLQRFNNDMDKSVRISVFNCTPFFYKTPSNIYNGIEHAIIKETVQLNKVKYIFYDFDETTDLWKQVMDDVQYGDSDISMCSQWLTLSKIVDTTFTTPYTQICATFLAPEPHLLPYSMNVIFPLSLKVWYLIIFFTIITTLVLYIQAKIYTLIHKEFTSPYLSLQICFVQVLRVLSQGSVYVLPPQKQFIFRWVFIFWSTSTLLITTGYSAGFTSILTTPRYTKSINTLQDFIEQEIHWGSRNILYVNELLYQNDSVLNEIANLFQRENSIKMKNERIATKKYGVLVKKMLEEFITDTEFFDENAKQSLKVMQECIHNYNVILTLRENLPLQRRLNRQMSRFIESGLLQFWSKDVRRELGMSYIKNFFVRDTETKNKHNPLKLTTIQGFFYFWLGGIGLAILVFLLEICWGYIKK